MLLDDPSLHVLAGADAGDVVLGGISDRHLEIAIDCLHREAGVNATVGRPEVMYREAVTRAANGECKHATQTAGRGEYAHVKVHMYAAPPGAGCAIENRIAGGEIPDMFVEAVEQGISQRLRHGVLAGYPLHDVRVEIHGGSYHDADSTGAAFRFAAMQATERALRDAAPVLMEPLMRLEVAVPADDEEWVMDDLTSRRGRVESCAVNAGLRIVRALVPASQLFGYEHALHTHTFGKGSCVCAFDSFVPCVVSDDAAGAEGTGVGVPRRPKPQPRDSAIAVPEPADDHGLI